MQYEWDEKKRLRNLSKHRVDFAIVEGFDWSLSNTEEDILEAYGEERLVTVGPIGAALYVMVWTERRGGSVRVISLRRATKQEVRAYGKAQGQWPEN